MIRKGQARWASGPDVQRQIQCINKLFGWPHETEPGRTNPSLSC